MTDFIIIAVLAVILGAAIRYIYRAKKSGAKCIGCSAGECNCGKPSEPCCCHSQSAPQETHDSQAAAK